MFNSEFDRSSRPRMGLGAGLAVAAASLAFFGAAIPSMFLFGSGSQFGSSVVNQALPSASARLAERIARSGLANRITDEQLDTIMQAMVDKASKGDLEAASFVFDLAARQRAPKIEEGAPDHRDSDSRHTILRRDREQRD